MIIQVLANGAAVALSLWLAHRSSSDGLMQKAKRKK